MLEIFSKQENKEVLKIIKNASHEESKLSKDRECKSQLFKVIIRSPKQIQTRIYEVLKNQHSTCKHDNQPKKFTTTFTDEIINDY